MNLITTTEGLEAACADLAKAPFIAVDTEFMREQTFWPRLCLIQIAGGDTEVLIDNMAPDVDLAPFFDLMVDENVPPSKWSAVLWLWDSVSIFT